MKFLKTLIDKFFTKEHNTKHIEDLELDLVRIAYFISSNDSTPSIDIELREYDDESIDALCKLLNILASDTFFLETIEMIRKGLLSNGREDLLIKIYSKIAAKSGEKILNSHRENHKDEPCIKPSDMLR